MEWLAAGAVVLALLATSNRTAPDPVRPQPYGGRLLPVRPTWRSKYGLRRGRMHQGLDLGAPTGTPVYAPLRGQVLAADADGVRSGYGATVVVRHADGIATLYSHLHSINVRPGQWVSPGDVLGTVGQSNSKATPMQTPPHLHFEVLVPPFTRTRTRNPVVNRNRPKRLNPTEWLQERGLREH